MHGFLTSWLAAAGGGSGGFSGGGGGGGGFSGGGGGGGFSGGGGGSGGGFGIALLAIIVVVVASLFVAGWVGTARTRRRRAQRAHAVETASAEAAEDQDYLAADRVRREAAELYVATQRAWDAGDREQLGRLVGGDLMVEWVRRLDDFDSRRWRSRVEVLRAPQVEYVGLVNREGEDDDRVTVRITCALADYVETGDGQRIARTGESDEVVTVAEYWTLARRQGHWMVVSIEQDAEGAHHLDEPIVATPEQDRERLRGEAVTELAVAEAVPAGFTTADAATLDFEGTARQEALDLSLADGRFAPDVLEVAARRAVGAWAEAVDGSDAELRALAAPATADRLLYGGDATESTRLVLRGPHVREITITGVDAAVTPATMSIAVEVAAVRYTEDRDTTTVVAGSRTRPVTFTERWTLALDGSEALPWRVVGVD